MRWEDERYVKIFTRDTAEWVALGWDAQCLFMAILRKVDRAGILVLGKTGARGLAGLLGAPLELVERVLPILVEDGCVRPTEAGIVVPNFIAAQEAAMSDKARQREKRERDRSRALGGVDAKRDEVSQNVTDYHGRSRGVTDGHAASLLSDPSCAELSCAGPPTPAALAATPGLEPEPSQPTATPQTLAGIWPTDPEPRGVEGAQPSGVGDLEAMARYAMTRPAELTPYERSRVAKVHARLVNTLAISAEDRALIVEVDTKLALRDDANAGPAPSSFGAPVQLSGGSPPPIDFTVNAGPKRETFKPKRLAAPSPMPEDE